MGYAIAIANRAIIRSGAVVPAGTPFEIDSSEVTMARARGWGVTLSETPESGNVIMPPEEEPGGIPGNTGGKPENPPEGIPEVGSAENVTGEVAPTGVGSDAILQTAEPAVLTGAIPAEVAPKMKGKVVTKVGVSK